MAWIFQGNPDRYDIDDYLSRYPQLIYWRTPRHQRDIQLGDRAFMWRSGLNSGAIALGRVTELPTPARQVAHPEALGDDLWVLDEASPDEFKTGIRIEDVRLSPEDGMVERSAAKADLVFGNSSFMRMPTGTVFRISDEETEALERLWGNVGSVSHTGTAATEGEMRLRTHLVRERSSRLRRDKLADHRRQHGTLACELCGFKEAGMYPPPMQDRAFEVHHRIPLSLSLAPVRTRLEDLAVICANCHRSVHASLDVDANYKSLESLFNGGR